MRIAVLVLAGALTLPAVSAPLPIVKDGKSDYVIAVPDDKAEARKVRSAAEAFQKWFAAATGAKLAMVREGDVGARPAFYLGRTKKGEAAGVPYAKLVDYVNCRKVVGRDVFLAGNDASVGLTGPLQHHDREYLGQDFGCNLEFKDLSYRRFFGTFKAVTNFLEEEGLVDILMPGENGVNVYDRRDFAVDDGLSRVDSAAIPFSNGRSYCDWLTTVAFGFFEIPHYKHWGGHTMPVAVPRAKYEKTHPEYFILKDGVRRPDYGPAHGGHHCVSNKDVQRLLLEELKRQYDLGFRWIQLGPTDGQVPCECEDCRKMHPDFRERQWLFSIAVAEEAKKLMPDAKIVILAYGFTRWAPTCVDRLPDNVVVEMTLYRDTDKLLESWSRFKSVPKLAYTYFFGDYHTWSCAPNFSPKYIASKMKMLRENNAQDVFKCGFIQDPGLESCVAWVFSRLLKDPGQDADALVDAFCEKAYGAAAEPMKRFYRVMNAGLDLPHEGHAVIDELRDNPHSPERMFGYSYRANTLAAMGNQLRAAEAAGETDPKKIARLRLVRRSYDFLNNRMKCYALQEAWNALHDPKILDLALPVYAAREKMLDGWYDADGKMKPIEGFALPYFLNKSRLVVVRGGGQVVPNYPELFRYGPNNVLKLKGLDDAHACATCNSPDWECQEQYLAYYKATAWGERIPAEELDQAKATSDTRSAIQTVNAFRTKYAPFVQKGRMIGKLVPLEPDEVFGGFWKDAAGRRLAVIGNPAPYVQTVRFRFPGSTDVVTAKVGPIELVGVAEPARGK